MDAIAAGRAAFVRTFRWTDGHADLAGVFRDADCLATLGPALAAPFHEVRATAVVALEARGFVVGALVARELGVGLVLARKPGSVHPGALIEVVSAPDWRGRKVTVRLATVLTADDRVLLVDDWIETGSQATAVAEATQRAGAELVGTSVIVDDTTDAVRDRLRVTALLRSSELPTSWL